MKPLSRRHFLQLSAGALASTLLPGCSLPGSAPRTIKLGYISPQSGALAGFGETDAFVLEAVRAHIAAGIMVAGSPCVVVGGDEVVDTPGPPRRQEALEAPQSTGWPFSLTWPPGRDSLIAETQ